MRPVRLAFTTAAVVAWLFVIQGCARGCRLQLLIGWLVAGELGQVLDTLAIENFVSVLATEGPQFASALEQHAKHYDVDIMNLQRADKLARNGDFVEVQLANGGTLKARSVILSTGARWREVNVPGEQKYRNQGVAYCPHCDGPLFKGKRVAVIGGGNSGVEAAIDLAGVVEHVTLIEYDDRLRADDVLQRKLRSLGNVDVIVSADTTEVVRRRSSRRACLRMATLVRPSR